MNIKNTKKLFEKYPKLFCGKDLSPRENLMCFDLECGDGWYYIIDKLCKKLTNLNIENLMFVQIKEKFGGLRVYPNGGNSEIWKLISKAEKESYKICETCGSKENVSQTSGWISTICQKCKNKNDQDEQ